MKRLLGLYALVFSFAVAWQGRSRSIRAWLHPQQRNLRAAVPSKLWKRHRSGQLFLSGKRKPIHREHRIELLPA